MNGYWYPAADLPDLQIAAFYPEKTSRESGVIRDFLRAHGGEYERFGFSVRVGQALQPDPTHLIGIQKSTIYSSRKRIDLVAVARDVHNLVEAKQRIEPAAIGQILTYKKLYAEDNPGVNVGALYLIGRYTDSDTQRSANDHGIHVLLYTEATPAAASASDHVQKTAPSDK